LVAGSSPARPTQKHLCNSVPTSRVVDGSSKHAPLRSWNDARRRDRRPAFPTMVLTPSTPFAYSQVFSRTFACFRVLKSSANAADLRFPIGFDSRHLTERPGGRLPSLVWPSRQGVVAVLSIARRQTYPAGRIALGDRGTCNPVGESGRLCRHFAHNLDDSRGNCRYLQIWVCAALSRFPEADQVAD
jgi:hypothetical protein